MIAGTARGHNLKSLKGLKTRPTLDRVREAVFNVIGSKVQSAVFLDLFAGTGAVGIESLSRGARCCYFNDIDKNSCRLVRENLLRCRFQENSRVFNMDAVDLLRFLEKEGGACFDVVYVDPPYERGLYDLVLGLLGKSNLVNDQSLVIAETGGKTILPERFGQLALTRTSRYGDTVIWYYQYDANR
ncbi:MAG: 16S rRNA (guanine(966)-N(2))-methyltransferase RsmD [Peptococcaceae bacterium]|nr:16S rRNA (guanine(966)-N(2))-methyltransferase RsmD [Peptococcaceae bacterium]MDH7525479.1 16S rRNA (guanine(966)-N(2))-methyltransferase RsmD [Peptococcaceae bacterium]